MPKLDARPYALHLFPEELRPLLDPDLKSKGAQTNGATKPGKQRKLFEISKNSMMTKLERIHAVEQERLEGQAEGDEEKEPEEEDEEVEEKEEEESPADDDHLSRVSTDSEDEDDDYNAEKYFDGGDDDDYGGDEGHDDNYLD